jgi:hypothetical protein
MEGLGGGGRTGGWAPRASYLYTQAHTYFTFTFPRPHGFTTTAHARVHVQGTLRMKRFLYMMDSMTDEELDGKVEIEKSDSRIQRIARGSGTGPEEVGRVAPVLGGMWGGGWVGG